MSPEGTHSLKSMDDCKGEENYFMEDTHSELIIEDPHLKKIQSERLPGHEYFAKNAVTTSDKL
jgi:hypothetical protein